MNGHVNMHGGRKPPRLHRPPGRKENMVTRGLETQNGMGYAVVAKGPGGSEHRHPAVGSGGWPVRARIWAQTKASVSEGVE